MSAEKEAVKCANENLREDYKSHHELTALTQLDSEPFDETGLRAGDTTNPELDGKYDDELFFQEKVNRVNEILRTAGVPKFPQREK